jgi:hypothetical protein|nr:MAG TPA: hypothetical protein [Crassvirales sp.]
METKIDIVAILKDKPKNTKLYSSIFGDVYFLGVEDNIIKVIHRGKLVIFFGDGRYYNYPESEPLLFPSKEMHDWSKFAWKKGDVLVSNDGGTEVIFNKWYDDTYTNFYSKHYLNSEDKNNIKYNEAFLCTTERYYLEDKDTAQTYINTIEKRLGGKLNLETLIVEKTQPEFKDWDFITIKSSKGGPLIGVFKAENDKKYYLHANLDSRGIITINEDSYCKKSTCIARLSTEEEKAAFFDALAKKGKCWNAEKKQIVALKSKIELKPFDKVLSRRCSEDYWVLNFYSHKADYYHICIDGSSNLYCIPYNEETAHLLGTTDDWEGGE